MISVTTATPTGSASGAGFLTSDASAPNGDALGGVAFLLELQAALSPPADPLADAELAQEAASEADPASEQAHALELQNLPTAVPPQALPPAIFAVPAPMVGSESFQASAAAEAASVASAAAGTSNEPLAAALASAAEPVASPTADMPTTAALFGSGAADLDVALPSAPASAVTALPPESAASGATGMSGAVAELTRPAELAAPNLKAESPAPAAVPLATAAVSAAVSTAVSAGNTAVAKPGRQQEASTSASAAATITASVQASGAEASGAEAAGAVAVAPGDSSTTPVQAPAPLVADASAADTAGMANANPLTAQAASSAAPTLTAVAQPTIEPAYRSPVEPQHMRLDSGPVQVEVLKLVQQGGGQIVMQLTPPDQGTYRLDLRLDAQGHAHLVVEGASDSVRTRLEQGEGGLREQLSQLGLNLQLDYRQPGSAFASADSSDSSATPDAQARADADGAATPRPDRSRASAERGLVHLYA